MTLKQVGARLTPCNGEIALNGTGEEAGDSEDAEAGEDGEADRHELDQEELHPGQHLRRGGKERKDRRGREELG